MGHDLHKLIARAEDVLARVEEWRVRHGEDLWPPAPLLVELGRSGGTFGGFDKQRVGLKPAAG